MPDTATPLSTRPVPRYHPHVAYSLQTLILTRNEAHQVARAIASALPLGPVAVIDSGSTDATQDVARGAGAAVLENAWPGFAAQRRWAIAQASAEWILFLDADEELTPELTTAIRTALDGGSDAAGFLLPRRSLFLDRWIRHGAWGRDRVLRLFRRRSATVPERAVHEEVVVDGTVVALPHHLLHYSQPDFATVARKLADYVPLMAAEIVKSGRVLPPILIFPRAAASFLRDFVLRRGFLDGWPGFLLAWWGAVSTVAKYAEARRLHDASGAPKG